MSLLPDLPADAGHARDAAAGVPRYALLVDIGNTRLKWCLHDTLSGEGQPWLPQGQDLCAGSVPSDSWEQAGIAVACDGVQDGAPDASTGGLVNLPGAFATALGQLGLRGDQVCLYAARVGPHPWESVLTHMAQQLGMQIDWVRSAAGCGPLVNGYEDPSTLGVDRFLCALATVHSFPGRPAVIVSVGTATTIDAVDAQARFLGGCILPGPALMAASLHRNTADLPQVQADWSPFPRNTRVAIASGIVRAQVGAVTGMLLQLKQQTGQQPLLVLSGGGRIWLDKAITQDLQCIECDNLVLQGLARWARTRREGG